MRGNVRKPLDYYYKKQNCGYETECWVWLFSKDKNGYGRIRHKKVPYLASRFFYERYKGDIPDGLHIHHLCSNTSCVNPEHLVILTQAEHNKIKRKAWRWGDSLNAREQNRCGVS